MVRPFVRLIHNQFWINFGHLSSGNHKSRLNKYVYPVPSYLKNQKISECKHKPLVQTWKEHNLYVCSSCCFAFLLKCNDFGYLSVFVMSDQKFFSESVS